MTRQQFFGAIGGAVTSVIPMRADNKPDTDVQELTPKGKLYVVKIHQHLSPEHRACIKAQLGPLSKKLGCEFIVCDALTDIYSPDTQSAKLK